MARIYAEHTASLTEAKNSIGQLLRQAKEEDAPIALFNRNHPEGYLIAQDTFEKLMNLVDDLSLQLETRKRLEEPRDLIEVDLDDL
ncbi:type II toxin-antitoxin system Phd/YefM family antitoxin [Piscirickettsia litoralis]|uniref:Antitoxin n=1 Tax=Piscirickettsia litoralis TaxID=1891921 RepID=A0ABX3A4G9_9GAMM|nr:type II toxin-antitoxin system Phd/YefM family antitoxin [Piscirickettsia litoralis]ODN41009.1 hypothetical protein BGC07_18430 [Piscirickettsia litoralis]